MTELVIFEYEGEEVLFDQSAHMWNLNAMHRATGGVPNKAPAQWLRNQSTQELIAALEEEINCANLHSLAIETREGRNGGTWARKEIALAYAHYLKPKFYIACNRWMLGQMNAQTGEPVSSTQLVALEARVAALEAVQVKRVRPTLADPQDKRGVEGQWDRGRELFDKALVLLRQCEIVDNADRSWQWLHYERTMVAARRIGEPSWRVLSTSLHWKVVVGCNAVNMFGAEWLADGLICPHRPSRPISDRMYTGPGKGNHQCILVPDKHLSIKE